MHVAIDAFLPRATLGGTRTYIEQLARSLAKQPCTTVSLLAPEGMAEFVEPLLSPRLSLVTRELAALHGHEQADHWNEVVLPDMLDALRPDAMIGPAYRLPPWDGLMYVTIHDAMFERLPQYYRKGTRAFLRGVTLQAMSRARGILAVSNSTRDDIVRYWQPDVPVFVTPLAASTSPRPGEVLPRPQPPPYILNVGGAHRRKRLDMLVVAFEMLATRPGFERWELAIVGCNENERINELRARSVRASQIRLLARLSDADLRCWYAHAEVFVYPTEYEGFGLTPLEAMACGAPVVTSHNSSLVEVLGDAPRYALSNDAEDLASAIEEVAASPRARSELVERGLRQAARYTWEDTARQTLRALEQAG